MIFAGAIYHNEIPAFLKPYLETDAMQRLKHIDMNCGMNYTSFPLFENIEAYSRFHHSLGCALIVWHFTQDEAQTLAALFHDIATPVFSHVVDFVYGDYLNQEVTENKTAEFIRNDSRIMARLNLDSIALEQVSDYHIYPVADCDAPRLCADRLEYIFGDLLDYRYAAEDDLRKLYDDLCVLPNEEGALELGFLHPEYGAQFALYALKCGRIYSGDDNRYAMEYLADILRDAMREGIITEKDLFTREQHVLHLLENSSLKNRTSFFRRMNETVKCDESDPDARMIDAKKRYVDPLCANGKRISKCSDAVNKEIQQFLNTDYRYYLKGIIR